MGVSTKEAPIHAVARDQNILKRKKPEDIRLFAFYGETLRLRAADSCIR